MQNYGTNENSWLNSSESRKSLLMSSSTDLSTILPISHSLFKFPLHAEWKEKRESSELQLCLAKAQELQNPQQMRLALSSQSYNHYSRSLSKAHIERYNAFFFTCSISIELGYKVYFWWQIWCRLQQQDTWRNHAITSGGYMEKSMT